MRNETQMGDSGQNYAFSSRGVRYRNPEGFERALASAVPGVQLRPAKGRSLAGTLRVAGASRVSMLSFDSLPMHAVIPPSHQMYGVTISDNSEYYIRDGKQCRLFDRDTAHILVPGETFDFRSGSVRHRILGTNFHMDIVDYAQRAGAEVLPRIPAGGRLPLRTRAGEAFRRHLAFAWREAAADGGLWNSPLAAHELEDTMCAALVWMLTPEGPAERQRGVGHGRLARLEDYIDANVTEPMTRESLARVVGVSLRTINRDFQSRHGMGVMAYVRWKRLERVHEALLEAEPESTRVRDVLLHFGITEFGKLSAAYRKAFGELPSLTLSRKRRTS